MGAKNLIYIGLGGVVAYLLLKKSNKKVQDLPQEESNVIEGRMIGGIPIGSGLYIKNAKQRRTKQDIMRENLNIDVRRGRVLYGEVERPTSIPKPKPIFRDNKPKVFGIEVPNTLVNLFKGNRKPINVYYANLERITPMQVFNPIRYKDRTLGTIYVSTVDDGGNMTWRNEATNEIVNIIYPTR